MLAAMTVIPKIECHINNTKRQSWKRLSFLLS
jgi:hypothetical protein